MVKKADDIFGDESTAPAVDMAAIKAELKRELMAELTAGATQSTGGAPADFVTLFNQMALSIAEMSHQGSKQQRPLDPKVISERAAAKERLDALILKTRKDAYEAANKPYSSDEARMAAICSVSPKYIAISKLYLGDRMIEPFWRDDATKRARPTECYWREEPNDAMRPANELAEAIFTEFRLSRGSRTDEEKKYNAVKPAWMTDHGLVIEGAAAPARREVEKQGAMRDDGLFIPTYKDPEAPFIHVLGTVADPAMQNYQGKAP